jgi:cytochrome c-type biogenesis protein CcmF
MFLLLLTGVGPLIAWRKSSFESLKRSFMWPVITGFAVSLGLFAMGIRHFYALMSFGLCAFVITSVAIEFFKGAGAIRSKSGQNLLVAMFELTHRNTRRYGGYLVHVGIVIIFVGFTGAAFDLVNTQEVPKGVPVKVGAYSLAVTSFEQGEYPNYRWERVHLAAFKNGVALGDMAPERRFYPASQTQTSQIALRRRLDEDLYINFAGPGNTEGTYILQARVFPLVNWIWLGYWVVLFGTIVCMIPSKSRLVYPRTEVVGIAGKHAKVEG